jgi:hypothetical protein
MNGNVYVSVLKPINLHVPFDIFTYPYLNEDITLKFGSWMHTKPIYDLVVDNHPDNFTVMTLKDSWIIENK